MAMPIIGGCTTGFSPDTPPSYTVNDPPDWLHEDRECESGYLLAVLELAGPVESVDSNSAVVKFTEFDQEVKTIVRYSLVHDSAATCTNAKFFEQLLGTIGDNGLDPYREKTGENPDSIYIKIQDHYYRISSFRVRDQVLP